jgi:hypothetical protein
MLVLVIRPRWLGAALDQTKLFETIDQAGNRHWCNFSRGRHLILRHVRLPLQPAQNHHLRPRQASIVLWLILVPEVHRWFKSAWPYFGSVLALVLFTPVLIWNADHHWVSHQATREGEGSPRD